MKQTWSQKELNLLKQIYPTTSGKELNSQFPTKTAAAVKTKASVLKLKKLDFYDVFTPEQDTKIIELFPTVRAKDIAKKLGFPIGAIYRRAAKLGVEKDTEALKQYCRESIMKEDHPGRKHLIKKGNIPKNKGQKQVEYMTPEAIDRTKATRFQPGTVPPNYRTIGSERIDKDGYILIKVRKGLRGWELKHRMIWLDANGAIPNGYNIQFKDGNRLNCKLDNLYMISKSEQMSQNTIQRYSPEVKTAIRRISKLTKIIKEHGKEH